MITSRQPHYLPRPGATREQAADIVRAYKNPVWLIEQMRTTHPIRGNVPFHLFPFQKAVLKGWLTNRYNIMLKPRQMGATTLAAAHILAFAMYRPYKNIVYVSLKATVAKTFLRKVKDMYKSLPGHLRVQILNGTPGTIGSATEIIFANGSSIKVMAATEDAGRSEATSLLVLDEAAFQRYASSIWGAAQQGLATGGSAIILSSAYGMGNFFHQEWLRAVQGQNGMNPMRLHWTMHPEKNQAWYEEQRRLLGAKRTAQEIDCDFLQSGMNVFDLGKIRAIGEDMQTRSYRSYSYGDGIMHEYYPPDRAHVYYIGADIASGRGHDYSAFSVMTASGVEVACYKGKISVHAFAELLMQVGTRYYGAMIAPEMNGIGESVISRLQSEGYNNLYYAVEPFVRGREYSRRESVVPGWLTSAKSRPRIIAKLDEDIDNDAIEINNPFVIAEATTFVYDSANRPVALGKHSGSRADAMLDDGSELTGAYTDDAIIALAITNEIRQTPQAYKGGGLGV